MRTVRPRSLFASDPIHIVAVFFGLLDSSAWIATYDSDLVVTPSFSLYYAFAVSVKAAVMLVFVRTIRLDQARILWPFYVPIVFVVLASILMDNTELEGVIQPLGALISLVSTIVVLRNDNIALYMKAFGLSCVIACFVFLYRSYLSPLDVVGGVFDLDGRYSFLGGTQPNLGGEIMFTGFVAFCIARADLKLTLATFVLFFFALYLLESRAAMLSILVAFFAYLYAEKIRGFSLGTRFGMMVAMTIFVLMIGALNMDKVADLFQLDDEYRGFGTGFVGREDHWEAAWTAFLQSPIVGVGFGYFRHDVTTPHSMWLGMLSMMGLTSIFIVIQLVKNGWRIYRINTTMFLLLLSFVPMTIFNDRFLNLNPYPFLFYVLLFLPREALVPAIAGRARRRRFDAPDLQPAQFTDMRPGRSV